MCVPELLTLIRCIRIVLFRRVATPGIWLFSAAVLVESAKTVRQRLRGRHQKCYEKEAVER